MNLNNYNGFPLTAATLKSLEKPIKFFEKFFPKFCFRSQFQSPITVNTCMS
jgi:hypothetical protein